MVGRRAAAAAADADADPNSSKNKLRRKLNHNQQNGILNSSANTGTDYIDPLAAAAVNSRPVYYLHSSDVKESPTRSQQQHQHQHQSIDRVKSSGHYNHALHTSFDKCHNYSIPCCDAVREIAHDIFPDIVCQFENSNKNNLSSIEPRQQQQLQEDNSESKSSNKKKKKKSKNNEVSSPSIVSSSSALIQQPTLLSQIIRQYLLENRQNETIRNSSGSQNGKITNAATKKKRKKKKKKQSSSTTTTSLPISSSFHAGINRTTSDIKNDKSVGTTSTSEGKEDDLSDFSPSQDLIESTAIAALSKEGGGSKPVESIMNEKSRDPTTIIHDAADYKSKINTLLDHILFQQKTKQANVIPTLPSVSPPPQNRTLLSLFDFIHTKYNEHQQQSKKQSMKRSSSSSSTKIMNNNKFILRISLREISNIVCDQIKCVPCKRDVEQHLDELYKKPAPVSTHTFPVDWGDVVNDNKSNCTNNQSNDSHEEQEKSLFEDEIIKSFQINPNNVMIKSKRKRLNSITGPHELIDDHYGKNSCGVEPSFDYALMEEGKGENTAITSECKQDRNNNQQGLRMNVVRDKSSNMKYIEISSTHHPLTMDHFINVIKDVIIPCGLHEIENFAKPFRSQGQDDTNVEEEEQVSPEILSELSRRYKKLCHELLLLWQRSKSNLSLFKTKLRSLEPSSKFDLKASQAIRDCEELLFQYMESVAEFLIKVHTSAIYAGVVNHEEQKWVTKLVEKLWTYFEETIASFVEPSLNHLWKVIQLDKNRTGSVPQPYNCPIRRQYLIEMLIKKGDTINKLGDKIQQVMPMLIDEHSVNETLTPESGCVLTRLVSQAVYFSWKFKEECIESFNNDIKTLLSLRNDLVCHSICQSKVSVILDTHARRMLNLRTETERLADIIDHVQDNENKVIYYPPKKYDVHWNTNKIMIEEKMIEYDILRDQERSYTSDTSNMSNLLSLSEHLCKQCRLLDGINGSERLKESDQEALVKVHQIPKWSHNLDKNSEESEKGEKLNNGCSSEKCVGGNGQRRVMCMIIACLYSWVQERSREWHADLTQEELLMGADDESADLNVKSNSEGGSRNRKGKKKKRKARKDSNLKSDDQEVNAKPAARVEPISEERENYTGDIEVNMTKDNNTRPMQIDEIDQHGSNPVELDAGFEDIDVNIFVIGKESAMSAQDYLSERFVRILKDDNYVIL